MPAESPARRKERLEGIWDFLMALPYDKAWEVLVRPPKADRSERQNNALWGVAYPPLTEHTGHTAPELHDHFLRAWFGVVEYQVLGETHSRPRRTTTTDQNGNRDVLGADEFATFYAFLQQQGAELGVYVPDPDPLLRVRAA